MVQDVKTYRNGRPILKESTVPHYNLDLDEVSASAYNSFVNKRVRVEINVFSFCRWRMVKCMVFVSCVSRSCRSFLST
jgi:hypothetical protein